MPIDRAKFDAEFEQMRGHLWLAIDHGLSALKLVADRFFENQSTQTQKGEQTKMIELDPLLTREELAQALKVSESTIRKHEREGLPVLYLGDLPRFDFCAVKEWMAANATAQKSPSPKE